MTPNPAPAAPRAPVAGLGGADAFFTVTRLLAAGATQTIDMSGTYVVCLLSNLPAFKIGIDNAPTSAFAPGITIRTKGEKLFQQIVLDNTGNTNALQVTLGIGVGSVSFNSTAGLDLAQSRAFSKQSFDSGGGVGAVAAQFAGIEIWNPAASAVIGVIRQLGFSTATAQTISIGIYNALWGAGSQGNNKYVGAAAAKLSFNIANSVTDIPLLGSFVETMAAFDILAGTPFIVPWNAPILLPPGFGIGIACRTANTTLHGWGEWDEVVG